MGNNSTVHYPIVPDVVSTGSPSGYLWSSLPLIFKTGIVTPNNLIILKSK